MRILVLSDVHSRPEMAEKIIANHPDIKHIFFLGDGIKNMENISFLNTDRTFYMVSGNCDTDSFEPSAAFKTLFGKKILYTHGNIHSVKLGLGRLKADAKAKGAQLVLFGHTHTAHEEYEDGIYYINPGAVTSYPSSYAIIDISEAGIMPNILTI